MLFLHVLLFSLVGIALGGGIDLDEISGGPKRVVPGDEPGDGLTLQISTLEIFNGDWSRYDPLAKRTIIIHVDKGEVYQCIDNGVRPPDCDKAFTTRRQYECITGTPAWSKSRWLLRSGMVVSGLL
jgi:hypothetical protein